VNYIDGSIGRFPAESIRHVAGSASAPPSEPPSQGGAVARASRRTRQLQDRPP
jgi:hypothetical protein